MLSRPSRKRAHEPDVDTGGGGDGGDNVRVVVRIRPENEKERQGNYRVIVQAVDENVLVFDPKEQSSYDFGSRKRPRDIRKRPNKDLKFAFDRVFGQDAENTDIYQETTQSVLTGLLNGYNCSVFAYGATGAGKTFTMLGSSDKPGVIYHTMIDLYSRIDNMKDTKICDVAVSYLEVYNEQIRDLLMPSQQFLPIREDPSAGVLIPGLSLHKPKTAEEILYMLQFGNQHRTQHPTDANAESSRSHAVFQVFVRQTDRTANISAEVRVAKLCLVDLAGSERATVTKNRGSRFREGANINRSLLALGNVINALAENKRKGFVPYRDSKLTRLLKDSLGGNCQTVMIAAVSPSAMTFEDTYNTLRYADRAKHIKASLKKNVLNVDFHVAKYGKIVEELRKEIKELKGKLLEAESRSVPGQVSGHVTNQAPQAVLPSFVGYQNDIVDYFMSHQSVRSKQLQEEISLRNLQWITYRKERCLARLNAFSEPQSSEYMTSIQNQLSLLRQKSSCLEITSRSSRSQLEDSCNQLGHLETKMAATKGPDNRLPEVLSQLVQSQSLRCEVQDLKQYVAFIKQVVRAQERELIHNERLVHLLLQLLNREHQLLQDHNLVTQYLHEAYTQVHQLSSGQELTWHDQGPNTTYSRGYTLQTMLELPSLGLKPAWSDPSSLSYSLPQGMTDSQCPIPSSQHPASNPVPQPPSVPEVYHFNANPPAPHTQQEAKRPFMDIKVDECSPPKPKRVLLPAKETRPLTSHHRNRHHSNSRSGNKLRAYSSGSNLGIQNTNPQRLSVPSSIDSSPDLEEDVETTSKFAKVFDTITKCKKFSHLHTGSSQQEESTKVDSLNETFTVDETYVINTAVCSNPVQLTCPVIEGTQCVGRCKTGSIFNPSQIHISPVTLGQCSCFHYLSVTGSQSVTTQGYGPENDSGASTIVDQSASSQSSVVSILTLVDGPQNLSQNLSTDECKDGEVHSTGSVSEQTSIVAGNSNYTTPTEMQQEAGTNKVTESNKTPIKGKSYAAALTSPSPDRPPLRQMGDANRPVQANDALRQQKVSKDRLSAQSSRRGSRELKENSQKLDKLGLPSLMDLGLHKDRKSMKKNQSMTPGYMQATKAHVQRKNTEASRSRMRSKSVSNLSARTAWQI